MSPRPVAEREIDLNVGRKRAAVLTLRVFAPTRARTGEYWAAYELARDGRVVRRAKAGGVDSMQALLAAAGMAAFEARLVVERAGATTPRWQLHDMWKVRPGWRLRR